MDPDPELLLFDLGDVLVEVSGYRELGPLLVEPLGEAAARRKWASCPIIREFETGGLTRGEFGIDRQHGGVYVEGPHDAPPTVTEKQF